VTRRCGDVTGVLTVVAVLLAATTVACSRGGELAVERATMQAREQAHDVRDQMRDLLAARDAPQDGPALTAYVLAHLPAGPDLVTFFNAAQQDRVILRQAITVKGSDDGGIGGATEEFVRLCIELSGTRSEHPAVDLRDTDCDAQAIQQAEPNARQDVRVTIRLAG
jgi:hypothetical protein